MTIFDIKREFQERLSVCMNLQDAETYSFVIDAIDNHLQENQNKKSKTELKWQKCSNSQPSKSGTRGIVIYQYECTGHNKVYNWVEAMWNGEKWDNSHTGSADNVFDNPNYHPLMWAIIEKPTGDIKDINKFASILW